MANMSIVVCDACQELGKDAQTWAIHGPDGSRKIDLCNEHGAELDEFLDDLAPGSAKPKRAARKTANKPPAHEEGGFDARVASIEDIEKLKKK